MKKRFTTFQQLLSVLFVLVILLNTIGCHSRPEVVLDERDVPIQLIRERLGAYEVPELISLAETRVRKTLPQAVLTNLVVFGNCDSFPAIEGRITFGFMQVERKIFEILYHDAIASIDTKEQTMNIRILTDPYLNYTPITYDEAETDRVLQNLAIYLQQHSLSSCTVEMWKSQNLWTAQCTRGEGQNWQKVCHITINNKSGEIQEILK